MKLSNKLKVYMALIIIFSIAVVPFLKLNWSYQGVAPGVDYQVGPNSGDLWIGLIYAMLLSVSGFMLARADKKRQDRGTVELRYHLTAAILVSIVGLLGWMTLTYFGWRYMAWLIVAAWVSYGLHWYTKHNNLKGISKHAVFNKLHQVIFLSSVDQ